MEKEKVLISACLLGAKTRYDGKSKVCNEALALLDFYELIPVCPEVDGGLETPRAPSEIQADGRIINSQNIETTSAYKKGAESSLAIARKNNIKLAILKENSPSCGVHKIHDGSFNGTLINGSGLTTTLLKKAGIKVISENEIPYLLESLRKVTED